MKELVDAECKNKLAWVSEAFYIEKKVKLLSYVSFLQFWLSNICFSSFFSDNEDNNDIIWFQQKDCLKESYSITAKDLSLHPEIQADFEE